MWLSGTDVHQIVEVAGIGAPLPVESQSVLVERIKDGIAEQMVDCTPHNVATGKTDLQGQKTEVVATGGDGSSRVRSRRSWQLMRLAWKLVGKQQDSYVSVQRASGVGARVVVEGGTWRSGGRAGRK